MIRCSRKRQALWLALAAGALASLVLAGSGLSEPAAIASKRAQADEVLAQIQQIDSQLDQVVEAYNQATERLDAIDAQIRANQRRLSIARKANRAAQRNLEHRLVELYVNGEDSLLEVILGSTSLDDLLDRVDAARRVSSNDKRILDRVRDARAQYRLVLAKLQKARAEQRKVVAQRAARKHEIESRLAERQQLLSSIRDEIAKLQAQEQRRQKQLRAEAERRMASEQSYSSSSISSAGGPTLTAVPASRYGGVVGIAMAYLGTPYAWGGESPSGFDCSGFVAFVFAQVGVSLPHSSYAQYGYGVPVSMDQLEPGDLVFFDGLGHVGIYIGGGQFIHSPHTGDVVKISSISGWYADNYVGARRIL